MSDRAERLLDMAYDAIFTFSLVDGRISYWNQGAERCYGWTAEEAIGQRPDDLLKTRGLDPTRDAVVARVEREGMWEGRLVQTARDGHGLVVEARWIAERDETGAMVGILEVNRDVTSAWSSATESHLILDAIVNSAVVVLDVAGRIRRWNAGAEQIFGWKAEEVLDQPLPDDLRGYLTPGEHEGWLPRKSGQPLWATISVSPVPGPAGRTAGLVVITQDLTEQRRNIERQVRHEQVKSEFLNLAAHELRSPVTVVAGYLSLLAEGAIGSPDPETKRVLDIVRGKVKELSDMIEEMVEVARVEEGTLDLAIENLDLNDLASAAVDAAALLVTPRHRLALTLAPAPVYTQGDRRRLQLVLANLVANAIKFSPEGGDIECRVGVRRGRAAIEIEDHGVGIAPEQVRRIFRRFERADAMSGGPGLGLYLAREIARLHGGNVTVTSSVGHGSTFTLLLPRAPAVAAGASA